MTLHLGTARHWLLAQLELETSDPPKLPKAEVVANWRIAKGTVAEEGFAVAQYALKACGTSNTGFSGTVSRMYRDLTMGLVQAFPAERGRLEAASTIVSGQESTQFGGAAPGRAPERRSEPAWASPLADDLAAMVGVWHDHLEAFGPDGSPVTEDPHGGVPGPFPYDNLVYFDFDGSTVTQTNVTFRGREPNVRTFESDLVDGVLRFRRLGPEAPQHVGVSGGPGIIWFVPESWNEPGTRPLQRTGPHPPRRRPPVAYHRAVPPRPAGADHARHRRTGQRRHRRPPRVRPPGTGQRRCTSDAT